MAMGNTTAVAGLDRGDGWAKAAEAAWWALQDAWELAFAEWPEDAATQRAWVEWIESLGSRFEVCRAWAEHYGVVVVLP